MCLSLHVISLTFFVSYISYEPNCKFRTAGGIILEISHGYHIESEKSDLFIELAEKTLDAFSLCMSGPWMVDLIPSRTLGGCFEIEL